MEKTAELSPVILNDVQATLRPPVLPLQTFYRDVTIGEVITGFYIKNHIIRPYWTYRSLHKNIPTIFSVRRVF